jgi:hypothetical protein
MKPPAASWFLASVRTVAVERRPCQAARQDEPSPGPDARLWSCAGVTDAGLKVLARLPRLREVDLQGLPNVTLEGTAMFPAHACVDDSP